MRDVDAARKREDAVMALALGFVEAVAAGEHQIGAVQELLFRSSSSGGAPRNADSSSMQSYTSALGCR